MQMTIEIADELVESYEKFILKYFPDPKQRFDPESGALASPTPNYTVEEYIEMQIEELSKRICNEFPPEAFADDIAEMKAIQERMVTRINPKKAKVNAETQS